MKVLFLHVILLSFSLTLTGQTLKGRILDADNREPIPLVSVFFDGTFVGTSSDEQGNFQLDLSDSSAHPLTISAIGYHTHILEDVDPANFYTILLVRDLYEIEEVSVSGKDMARRRKVNMRLFKSEFLGSSRYARRCYILNEEDITFNYDSDQDTLRAFAYKPLVIHNEALGYHFEYHLQSFEFDRRTQSVSYKGNIVFTYDMGWEGHRKRVYHRRRRLVYTGSIKEFIRVLWSNKLESSDYSLRNYSSAEPLYYKDLVFEDEMGNKWLRYPGVVEILHPWQNSKAQLLKEKALIGQDGFFDPDGISWGGRMSVQRIADFLPYEYSVRR